MNSSAFPSLILGGLTLFISTMAIGWKLAENQQQPDEDISADTRSSSAQSRPARSTSASIPDHIRRQMHAIRSTGSAAERMRMTIDLVNSIPHDEIPRWIDAGWFDLRNGFDMTLFNTLIYERWEKEDPEGMIAWSLKTNGNSSAMQLLSNWANEEPQRVFDYFKTNPNSGLELMMLQTIARSQPSIALSHLQELLSEGSISRSDRSYVSSTITTLAEKSPAELAAVMDSIPLQWRAEVEKALCGERLKQDFTGELADLLNRPDGLSIFTSTVQNVSGYQEKILAELHNLPPSWIKSISENYYKYINGKNAAQWINTDLEALGLTTEEAARMRMGALGTMPYEEMLKLLPTMDIEESEHKALITNAFRNNNDPERSERLLALLSPEDRAIALVAQEPRGGQVEATRVETPAQWFEEVAKVDVSSRDHSTIYTLSSMLESWDTTNLGELSKQFTNMPADQKDQIASVVLRTGYDTDRNFKGQMIQHVLSQAPAAEDQGENSDPFTQTKQNVISLTANHVAGWAETDPEAASQWVQTLPEGDAKLWAQKNLARNWALYDPGAVNNWLKSLPPSTRSEVTSFMEKGE